MERTLNLELLRTLIGDGDDLLLPSPERLIEVMAFSEMGLITRERRENDLELLELTGWYLFGTAASRLAPEVYSVALRRQAFQVAGHLLDLALRTTQELTDLRRAQLCFAVQIASLRGDLHPNALAIYRKAYPEEWIPPSLLGEPAIAALSCATRLLAGRIRSVRHHLTLTDREIQRLRRRWGVETLSSTLLGSASEICLGLKDLLFFQQQGDRDRLQQARSHFLRGAEDAFGDRVSKWTASHLLDLSNDLERASPWTVLPPDVPDHVKLAFTRQEPQILALWPPQVEFLGGQHGQLFDPDTKRVFLASPTSAGKTLLAQVLVASHLGTGGRGACFVVPTRSLSAEVSRHLRKRLQRLGVRVTQSELLTDDEPLTETQEGQVIVMTPEKLSFLLHRDPERVLNAFGLFVFDEVHNVGDGSRGWLLESLITFLHDATVMSRHRIILMSAAIGNKNHFVHWMTLDDRSPYSNVDSVHEEWRGPRRITAVYRTRPYKAYSTRSVKGKAAVRKVHNLQGSLFSPLFGRLLLTEPVGELVLRYKDAALTGPSTKDAQTTPDYLTVIPLVKVLMEAGLVLVVIQNKKLVEGFAQALAASLSQTENSSQLEAGIDEVRRFLGDEHPLTLTLPNGVAFHHGDVPLEIRSVIEEAAQDGHLRCIVCTSSLTEGVNLPVHSVVIVKRHDHQGQRALTPSQILNALGRAGRGAIETEGVLILVAQWPESDTEVLGEAQPSPEDLQTRSTLTDPEVIRELVAMEQAIAERSDALFELEFEHAEGFVQFVWFLAANPAQLSGEVTDVLLKSLAGQQRAAPESTRSTDHLIDWTALTSAVQAIVRVFEETAPEDRQRWARASTSLATSYRLDQLAEVLENDEEIGGLSGTELISRIVALILPQLLTLSEFKRSVRPARMDWPHLLLLDAWLSGSSALEISALTADPFISGPDVQKYVYDVFEFTLPWLLSALLDRVQSRSRVFWAVWIDPPTLVSLVRFGVPLPSMLPPIREGRLSRGLVTRLWKHLQPVDVEEQVLEWLRTRSVFEWQEEIELTALDVRALLIYVELQLEPVTVDETSQVLVRVEGLPEQVTTVHPIPQSFKGTGWLTLSFGDEKTQEISFPVAYTRRALELLEEGYLLSMHPSLEHTLILSLPLGSDG